MALSYDYSSDVTITIQNIIKPCAYHACDPGAPRHIVEMEYKEAIKDPCLRWEPVFNADGTFKQNEGKDDYIVKAYVRTKSTDRRVPAYRTANSKVLKAAEDNSGKGDTMKFVTNRKDEVVFYEKFAEQYVGELSVTFDPAPSEVGD